MPSRRNDNKPSHPRVGSGYSYPQAGTGRFQPSKLKNKVDREAHRVGHLPTKVVASLPSLPDEDFPDGILVFNSSDGHVYRNQSGTWTATAKDTEAVNGRPATEVDDAAGRALSGFDGSGLLVDGLHSLTLLKDRTPDNVGAEAQVHRGTTAPADISKLWLDTSVTPHVWKRHNGTAWVKATPEGTSELTDDAGLGEKAKWSQVADDDGNRPSDGATVGAPTGTTVGSRLAEDVDSDAAAGRNADDDLTAMDGTYVDRTNGKVLLAEQNEPQVHRGTTAPSDTSKLWIDTSVTPHVWKRHNGTSWVKATPTGTAELSDDAGLGDTAKWSLVADDGGRPEDGATVGAQAGTNLKDSLGTTLGDADVVTSQGTAADTAAVNGTAAADVDDGAARARSGLNGTGQLANDVIDGSGNKIIDQANRKIQNVEDVDIVLGASDHDFTIFRSGKNAKMTGQISTGTPASPSWNFYTDESIPALRGYAQLDNSRLEMQFAAAAGYDAVLKAVGSADGTPNVILKTDNENHGGRVKLDDGSTNLANVAGVVVSTSSPSGDYPEGTIWIQV